MTTNDQSRGMLIARLDRIPVWSLPGLFVGIIGVGFLFTFYDIFDINVSFIQTCSQIVPMLLICGFLILAAIIAQFGTATRSRMLEEVSP